MTSEPSSPSSALGGQKTAAAPNFDLVARPYHLLERLTFGRALHRARLWFLPQLSSCRRALILGDGDGRFTAALMGAHPTLQVDAVDLSPAMLHLLSTRARRAHPTAGLRLSTHHCSALDLDLDSILPAGTSYDLVVSHFFLDCLTDPQLELLLDRLRPYLAPGAVWLVSDFRIPSSGLLRVPAQFLVRGLYLGFRLLTGLRTTQLPDHVAALGSSGMNLTERHFSLGGLLTSELWHLALSQSASNHLHLAQTAHPAPIFSRSTPSAMLDSNQPPTDPVPNPEPPSPSLPEPDPGVFHHEPAAPAPPVPSPS